MAIGGAMVGSLITGQMVSRLSRFNILIIFNVMVIMSSILLLIPALIESLPVFAIAKFLIGVACGGFAVICPIYVNEPPQNSTWVELAQLSNPLSASEFLRQPRRH